MKRMKKFAAVLITAVMTLGLLAVNVGAESIADTAQDIRSGEKVSVTVPTNKCADYRIITSEKGNITVNFDFGSYRTYFYLYDANGNNIMPNEISLSSGTYYIYSNYNQLFWNNTIEKVVGTATFENIPSGVYYIRLKKGSSSGNGALSVSITYPSGDSSSFTDGTAGKISYMTLTMSVGDSIKLGTVVKPEEAEVIWTSSKKSVAEVSESGRVTAKKVGKTVVTAKSGKSKVRIMIIVED